MAVVAAVVLVMKLNNRIVIVVEFKQRIVVVVEFKQYNCGGGGGGI